MKRLLLIPALVGTMAMATDYNYEVTPLVGYNFTEGNLNLDDEIMTGIEAQYNGFDFPIKPELSVLYSGGIESEDIVPEDKTNTYRVALNGVYEFEGETVIPFVKAGVGYETMQNHIGANTDGAYVDAGAGVKVPFNDWIALKLEAIYMLKHNEDSAGANMGDSNLALLAGVTFSFGEKAKPAPVDGDDDNDGVPNSIDECPTTPAGDAVNARGCTIDGDDDNDGVANSIDECPTTPAGDKVDAKGCSIVVDGDDDNDGVLNSVDKCPRTHPDVDKVDADGCAVDVNLHINFKFDSYEVTEDSHSHIKDFGGFMGDHKNYTAVIEGHTDSTGPAAYNQKLSEKRANVVKELIVSEGGVSADRLTAVGKGESTPVATNATKEGRAQNRRTEAHITKN
jgi:OOP family OmpA-OmpF porin